MLFNEVVPAEALFEALVDGDGNLPENEGVCVDVVKRGLLLVLDEFPEDADGL